MQYLSWTRFPSPGRNERDVKRWIHRCAHAFPNTAKGCGYTASGGDTYLCSSVFHLRNHTSEVKSEIHAVRLNDTQDPMA